MYAVEVLQCSDVPIPPTETSAFRRHGGPSKGAPETPRTPRQYSTERLKGGPQYCLYYEERC